MRTIVCDAGPIIHLYEAHSLQLLRRTGDLFLPSRVFDEVHAVLDLNDPWPEWLSVETLSLHEQNEAGIWKKSGDLHDGEAEALVLARRKKADWFLTDDSTTRLFVALLGMDCLLYTSDAADYLLFVDLGGRRSIKNKHSITP